MTDPRLSGSQLTLQLRQLADSTALEASTYPAAFRSDFHHLEDLLTTAADVIDRLTTENTRLSSRKPRPVVFILDDPTPGSLSNPTTLSEIPQGLPRYDLTLQINTKSGTATSISLPRPNQAGGTAGELPSTLSGEAGEGGGVRLHRQAPPAGCKHPRPPGTPTATPGGPTEEDTGG